jgi:hypothetical protein
LIRDFTKTVKQYQAIELMKKHTEILFEGGSRSGKTFIIIYAILARGFKYPGSMHVAVRKRFNHAKVSLWIQTIPQVFKLAFPSVKYKENKSDWFIEFGEGSQLWIGGTDEKERIEKILGTEWATIFLNEISEQTYNTYELFKTRLNPPQNIKPLYLMDHNPPKKSHWSYVKFHDLLNFENKQKLSDDIINKQYFFQMNPIDNTENLNEGYFQLLESLSERKRKRFRDGLYGEDKEGALWKTEWIIKNRILEKPKDLIGVVVAIDPNVTEDRKVNEYTDEAGIITVGKYKLNDEDHYCVIRDDSTPGLSWGEVGCQVYREEMADKIVGEVNQGGDLIEMNLRNYDKDIAYDDVRATRGKELRADPVADLYRRGYVHHIGEFPNVEDELTTWVPGQGRSPNRLDALIWGISYLAGFAEIPDVIELPRSDITKSKVRDLPL